MLRSQLRWLVHLVRGRIPPFGGFLGMHNWEENPRVESECAGEIMSHLSLEHLRISQ